MYTIEEKELDCILGGSDSYARDAGQVVGGATGWVRANTGMYVLLGPGIGGLVALVAGLLEAQN